MPGAIWAKKPTAVSITPTMARTRATVGWSARITDGAVSGIDCHPVRIVSSRFGLIARVAMSLTWV
jgi:hypothetical protein